MRNYTENFKKAVVKKILILGIQLKEMAEKLNIFTSTIWKWRKQFGEELQLEIEKEFLDTIKPEEEEEIDIDYLIAENERKNISVKELKIEQTIDKILEKGNL